MGNISPFNKRAVLSILYWLRPHSLLIAAVAETNGGSKSKGRNCLEWSLSIRMFKIANLSNVNPDLIFSKFLRILQTPAIRPSVRYVPLNLRQLNDYFYVSLSRREKNLCNSSLRVAQCRDNNVFCCTRANISSNGVQTIHSTETEGRKDKRSAEEL